MDRMKRGYAERQERLPETLDVVDAAWLTRTLGHKYPGLVVERMEHLQHITGHTTKLRVKVDLSGPHADRLPSQLCMKANWTGNPLSGPANVNEARFYRDLAEGLPLPAPPASMPIGTMTIRATKG